MADIKILKDLVAVNLEVNLWTARRKMQASDLGGAQLPPSDLASLGSKRVCDPAKLAIFSTIRARTAKMLDSHGIRFLGGWAIPAKNADFVARELESAECEFDRAKTMFLQDYDKSVAEWIAKHPEWSEFIKNSVVSSDYVKSKMNFKWQMYSVGASESSRGDASLGDAVGRLGETLFGDVSKAARDCWEHSFRGETDVSRRALSPVYGILNKLRALSFVDTKAGPAADIVEAALSATNKVRGRLCGSRLLAVQGVLNLLMNPSNLYSHCDAIISGARNAAEVVASTVSSPQRQAELEEAAADGGRLEAEKADEAAPREEALETKEAYEDDEEEEEKTTADSGIGIPSYGLW